MGNVEPSSISAKSGFEQGQQILAVNDKTTPTWVTVHDAFIANVISRNIVSINVIDTNGIKQTLDLDLSSISIYEMVDVKLLNKIGLAVVKFKLPPVIVNVQKNSPAEKNGLLKNDRIIAINGNSIDSWEELVEIIKKNPDEELNVEVLREETLVNIELKPENYKLDDENIGRIGVGPAINYDLYDSYFTLEQYSIHFAILRAFQKTWEMSVLTLNVLAKMITGDASVKNLSGPITIADYAGQQAGIGFTAFLTFLAIVSISLGVLNLLPIPLLDGGHLVYYVIEFITGRPVSDSIQITGQQIGLFLLLGLMGLALYNDFVRLLG